MNRDWQKVVEAAVEQGWRVEETKDGWQLKPAAGEIVTVHGTPSDFRARQNVISRMRRSGFTWPPKSKKERRSERREEQE